MFGKLLHNKKSIMITWFLSYLIVLLIPIATSIFIYATAQRLLERGAHASNSTILKGMQQRADALLTNVNQLSNSMLLNSRVQEIAKMQQFASPEEKYLLYNLSKDLNSYMPFDPLIDDLYIYYKNLDVVVSRLAMQPTQRYFEIYIKDKGISYEDWHSSLEMDEKRAQLLMIGDEGKSKLVMFVSLLLGSEYKDPNACVVISIDSNEIIANERNITNLENGLLIILDRSDRVIASSKDIPQDMNISYLDFPDNGNYIMSKIGNENHIISFEGSNIMGWKYIYMVEQDILLNEVKHLKTLFVLSFVLAITAGTLLIGHLTRRNSMPIIGIAKKLQSESNTKVLGAQNEIQFIRQFIEKELEEKKHITSTLEKQKIEIRNNMLVRLLKGGSLKSLSTEDSLAYFKLEFKHNYFVVALFCVDNYEGIFNELHTKENYDDLKLAQLIVKNVVGEKLNGRVDFVVVETDDMLGYILNIETDDIEAVQQMINQCVTEAKSFIFSNFNFEFSVSVSNVQDGISNLQEAYAQTLETMEYKMVMGFDKTMFYKDIHQLPQGNYYYPIETERQLVNCIKAGDFDNAAGIVDRVFKKNFSNYLLPIQIAKCLMFNIVSTMIKTIDEIIVAGDNSFIEELRPVERLLSCHTIHKMELELLDILKSFCTYMTDKSKSQTTSARLKERIDEFVECYYDDINLNVSLVAQHFNMHPNYISKVFKEESNEGLLEYINRLRIEKARVLLETTDAPVSEISKQVGFSSSRTFIRVFIKYTGVAPGKYRNNN